MQEEGSNELFHELIRALQLWPIWLRIGLQDLRIRFRRSALGVGWIFLNLGISILAIGMVYSHLLGQEMKTFLPFLTAGLIPWGYFTSSILEGGNAFVTSEGYIKQIGLPVYVYVFRFFVTTTMTMLISFPVFFVIALVYSIQFHWEALWAFVGILLFSVVSFLTIAIFAHLNARFRDTSHVASVGLQVLFFITPIVWPPESVRSRHLRWIIDSNPLYHLIEVVRRPLLVSKPAADINYLVVLLLILGLFVTAWVLTKCYTKRIAFLL